jgi:hypothetical protein
MNDLSSAAQAVLTASAKAACLEEWSTVNDPPCHPSDSDWNGCHRCVHRLGLAAALCAAADQVVPVPAAFISPGTAAQIRAEFLAIAAELRGDNNTGQED